MDASRIATSALLRLPPETAHRAAGALLGLPIAWERLGRAPRDERLHVMLAGIDLANRVGLAAGFDKACRHLDALSRLGFGYVVGGTITRRPRRGNPRPRIARIRERRSLVNAMGLPNPGAEAAARTLSSAPRRGSRFASIADEELRDVLETHSLLEPHVDAIELNASCPNVSWGRDRDNEAHLAALLRELGARRSTPLFVKLPPFRTDVERDVVLALAQVVQERGADGLTCSNTRPVADARLASRTGGLSGRDLFEDTPRIVADVARATGGTLPINACGGITTAHDALACMDAGATTVQVYTAFVFEGPALVGRLVDGMLRAGGRRAASQAADETVADRRTAYPVAPSS
jgi:dihydroorotate dehydrogenase